MTNRSVLIFTSLSIVLLLTGCAGSSVSLDKTLTHSEVVKVEKTKDVIFISAKEWMAKNFVNSKEAIRVSNQDEGKLVGRLRTQRMTCTMYGVEYLINWTLTIKDGRYRIQQSPVHGIVYLDGAGGKRKFKKIGAKCIEDVKPVLKKFRESLKKYIESYEEL